MCRNWLEGQRSTLWPSSQRSAKRQRQSFEEIQRHERAYALVQEALLRKACGALLNEPPVEVVGEMQQKHRSAVPRSSLSRSRMEGCDRWKSEKPGRGW